MADKDNKSKLTYHVWDKDNNEYDIPDEVVQQRGMDNFAKDFEGGYITMFDDKKQKVDVPIEDVGEYRKQGYMWYDTSGNATPINEVGKKPSPSKEKEQSQYPQEVKRGELKKPNLISQALGMMPKVDAGNIGREQKVGGMIANMLLGDNMQVQQPAQKEASPESKEAAPVTTPTGVVNNEGLMDAKLANYIANWKQRPDKQSTYFENMVADLLADGTANSNEEAVNMVMPALRRYAHRSAMDVTNQVVSSLPDDTVQDAEQSIGAQWYSHGVQDKLNQEADSMGISYDDYVAHYLKPAMVQSLVNKYGPNYRNIAEGIATRLYSHDEHVQDRLMKQDINDALSSVINKYVSPSVVDEYNKAQEAGSKAFTEGMEGSQFIPANLRLGTALGAQYEANEAKDPAKVLSGLQQKFGKLYRNPKFLNDMSNAAFKVMQRYGLNGGMTGDPKQFKPMINSVLKNELDQLEIKGMMPKGSAEYIMKTGLGNTIVGKITRKAMQTDYQNWLEDIANQQYQPGFWENVASGSLTFAGDAWSYWLPGAAGGKLTKSMVAKAEGRLAGDLMAKGMERKMAERAAKVLIGKSKAEALKSGAAHGAVTFGGQSAISKPIDEVYRTGQFDENGNIYNPSVGKVIANTLGEVVKQSAVGAIMQGGTIANMVGKGRGLATNILADVGGKVVDSGIMTGHQMLERMAQDPNFKPTGKDAAESFLESMANLTAIGLPGMVGKYARFKDAREFNKKFDFTDQDIAELKRFGYDGLRDAFEKMGIGEYAVEGENAQRLDGQLTQKYMDLMNDKSVTEVLKAKMMAVVEGKRPSSFSPVVDSVIVQPMDHDGKVYLETLNKDGGIIDRKEFSSLDEAQKADKKLEYEKTLGLASVLEGEFHNEFTQEHLEGLYNKAAQKYNMGEKLTDEDKAAVYLHQNAGAIKDIMDKQQKGFILTDEEQKQINAYRHYYDSALENSSVMREFVNTFEDSHGVARGTLRKALESKDKKYAPLVESYLKELYNSIELKREMKQTMDDLYNTAHGNEQKRIEQGGIEGEKPTAPVEGSAGGQEPPVSEGPSPYQGNTDVSSGQGEGVSTANSDNSSSDVITSDAFVMGQNAYKNGDSEALQAIDYNSDLATGRLQRAFADNEKMPDIVANAYNEGRDMEQFVAQRASSLTPAQKEAISKYVEAMDAKKGAIDALQHADDGYGEALKQQLWPYQTEDGNIVPATLDSGKQVFLKKDNEYGGAFVVVPDEQGLPTIKQVSKAIIIEKGTPVSLDEYIESSLAQQKEARAQQFISQFDGSGLKPNDRVTVAMEEGDANIDMTFAGYSEDGKIVLTDGKDYLPLSKEEFAAWRKNALDNTINEHLDAEDDEREQKAVSQAEADKKQRYANGIVGLSEGQPDYSSKDTDPNVAAEYLQEQFGEDHGKLLNLVNGSRDDIKTQLANKKKAAAEYQDWLDTNADLDPEKAKKVEDELSLVNEQIADLDARFKNWNTIRNSVMTPDELRTMKEERKAEIERAGIDKSSVLPDVDTGVRIPENSELKDKYPTQEAASGYITSERRRVYKMQEETQREIDGVDKILNQYMDGDMELSAEQLRDLNTTKAELANRQNALTADAKALKGKAESLNILYIKERAEQNKKNLEALSPKDRRKELVAKALEKKDMKAIKEIYKDASTDVMDLTPRTLEEFVSERLFPHSLNAESLAQELGSSNFRRGIGSKYDTNKYNYLLANNGEGLTISELAKRVWEDLSSTMESGAGDGLQSTYSDQDVRNAILDMFKTYDSVREMRNVTLLNRIAAAENELSGEEEWYEQQKEREIFEKQKEIDEYKSYIHDKELSLPSESELDYINGLEFDRMMEIEDREREYKQYVKSILPELADYDDRSNEEGYEGGSSLGSDSSRRGVDEGNSQGEEVGNGEASSQSEIGEGSDSGRTGRQETGSMEPGEGSAVRGSHLPQEASFGERLKSAIVETETEPTEAQKKAGNYKKGHLSFGGYDYTVETPKGVTRSGKDEQGKPWSVTMHDTYGYILGKIGVDGDHIDMFINDSADLDTFDGNVYVVDQVNPETGEFDEHKVMYGYPSEEAATEAYLANYSKGWKGLGNVTSVPKATFDKWLESSDRKTKPFADYAMVQKEQAKFDRDVKEVKPSEMTEAQKVAYDAVSTMLKKAGIPVKVVSNEDMEKVAEAQDNLNLAMLLNQPEMRFKIKTPEEKQAAENAYNFAKETRPDKWKQYAVVDMSNPNKMPEYFEKQELARKERSYYNKLMWGNYKVFNLDKSFEDNVAGLTGSFPSEFDPYKIDEQTNKRNELKRQIKETEDAYNSTGKERKEYQNQLMKEYMDEHGLASEDDIPYDVWSDLNDKAHEKYQDKLDSLFAKYKDLDRQLKAVAEPGVQYLKGKGVVYGYTDGKEIVLNQEHLNPNTPIHEYQHLWRTAAKEMNPELIEHGDKLIMQTQLFADLKQDPNYNHLTDEQICDEAFARLTGEDGAAILEQMAKDAIKENPLDTAKELSVINKLKEWLKKFWYWTLDTFTKWKPEDIKKMTLEDIRNLVLRDLANGVDPRNVKSRMTKEDAVSLRKQMADNAEQERILEHTEENWQKEFGKDSRVTTPIGSIKLGENQYKKAGRNDRIKRFGLLKPTLERPDVILEKSAPKEGAERQTKYLFIKSFKKADGNKILNYESITVKQGEEEVAISAHQIDPSKVLKELTESKVLWNRFRGDSNSLGENQGSALTPSANNPSGKDSVLNPHSDANIRNNIETTKENGGNLSVEDKIKAVSQQFGVDEADVAMYANAIKKGSTAEAARARANIKRHLLQANEDKISSLKELLKYTKPVNEALKENFGDVDAMIEERVKQVEAQRNAMEAARKRAEEEEAKRQKHLEELSVIPDDQLDKQYMDALAKGDDATAREMLDEAARRKGYDDTESAYQGVGAWAAPGNPGYESDKARRDDWESSGSDVNLEDMALGYTPQPDDYFSHPERYSQNTPHGLESVKAINTAIDAIKNGEKDVKVKVYRAVPTSVKEGKLRNGDWVTPSKKYADIHGNNRLEGKYRIIEDEVPANQLWWDGNDANEFGFDDGKAYKYKNAKNNRKLNDLVTYDDEGDVIPPSKRFNSRKSDIRFMFAGEKGAAEADKAEEKTYRMDNLKVAEIYSDKKGNLTAKSYYKTKKGVDQRVMEIKNSLLPTPEASSGSPLSDGKGINFFSIEQEKTAENERKIADSVVNTANKLGGAEATVYFSLDDVPEEYRSEIEQGAKGWYDPETHSVHVYLPNCEDGNDAQRTVFHEKIGHEGMEVLLGGEDGVRKFANFVYRSVGKDVRGKIIDFANKYDPDWKNPDRMNVGTQEYIAHLAEEGPKTAEDFSLWTKIKHYLIKVLKKLGIRVPGLLNDKDLRYYLMKAGKALHVWDNMPKEKQETMMKQASNAEIKDALSNGPGKGKPQMKKGESTIQYIKRVQEWRKWQNAREDENDPEPPMFYDFDKDEAGKKEWAQLNKDWRDSHHLVGEEPTGMPIRMENEEDDAYMNRIHEYEKWQAAMKDQEDPMPDMFAFEKKKQEEVKRKYEDWLTRHELNEQNNADLDLYEGKIYSEQDLMNGRFLHPAETNPKADALEQQVMQDLAEVTSTDVSKEGAAKTVKHAVIHRRKNMEEASADDAIYINDVKNRIEKMADSGAFDKLLSDYKGKPNRAEKLAEAIPYIIEAPRRLRDLAHDLNATGAFEKGHIHIQPTDVEAIQPFVADLIAETAKMHTVLKDDKEVKVYDDPQAVSEVANKLAQAINANHQGEEGFVPIDGTDILSKHVLPLVKQQIVPVGIDYKNLSPEMKAAIDSIRDWYNYTYDWLKDNHTLREDTGYNADYVNHIWDKEKSDKRSYAMYVENRQRTKSPNEKPRTISTLMEGISVGLVPKTTDITKMMAYYSRSNIEAWVNKTMLQELSGLNVIERNEDGEIVSSDPLLSSTPPFNLEQYKYFEIPGLGPVWVYKGNAKDYTIPNIITGKKILLYRQKSAAKRFGVVFEQYESSPFWETVDTLASSAKKLELGFSGFHAGALTEVYMVQNMVEFGPKKAMANFMKYIFVDTMKNHQLPCFANPEDFQEAATHLVKFGATNDYAAADVQNMFDNMRDAMMKVQEKLKDGNKISGTVALATMPLKVATQMLSLINKGMDRALWDFLHDGLKLATYRMRADKTNERAKKKGWTEEELSRALDEDGQFVNDMFGGQHWDILGASHRTLRYAGRVLLSPDWNASTTRHFLALTGYGSIWNEATFENFKQYYQRLKHKELMPEDEGRRSRQISALLCYGIGFMVFYEGIANGINAAFRALDEEKERKKAEEIRKTNPSYKSMYELAYGDEGMKWYDYLMRGNSLGQQSKIFMGRYADGTEMYIRHGKQFREVPEYLFNHKGELEFPGPMVQRMIGKANPMVRMTLDDINYLSDFQASHADQEIQRKYGKTIGLLYKDALYWAPFLIPSQENKEFKAVDFFFPSSKGFSPWKAQSYFKDFILGGDMEGVVMTYQSCQRNGIDPEAQIKAAIGSVKALESAEMSDGVTSLQEASKRFDAAKSITEKKKMRQKMKKFLSQSEYKAFTQKEALDMVQGYLNGDEDLKEMEKAESKYLMKAKAEDVTEDWRIQNVWNGTMETYQEYQRLKDVDKAKANAFKDSKTNKRLFAARKAISAARRKMNKAKKQMDGQNDAAKLVEIRNTRKELLKTLNGME
jgi:hypothetical protein